MPDRLPPHDIDAERAVLGSVLTDHTAMIEVMEVVTPADFSDPKHALIFGAMLTLYERGLEADVVTVAGELNSHLEEAGGAAYLALLGKSAPTSVYASQYAAAVANKAVLRKLIRAAGQIASAGYDISSAPEAVGTAYAAFREATAGLIHERTRFERAGFRAYSLAAPDDSWKLVLSRVDVNDREPKGLVTVYANAHPEAFADLGDYALCRTVGLFGGTNLKSLAKELSLRLAESEKTWLKRLDYLAQRTMREAQAAAQTVSLEATPERPTTTPWMFDHRVRLRRTISLFGPGSAGKTTLADGLSLSACTGVEIVPGWRPMGTYPVAILDWDEGEEEERVRLHAMCSAYGLDLHDWHYRRMNRPLIDCADDVGHWLVDTGAQFLIVNPVARAVPSSTGDPSGPINDLYDVLGEFHTTNLLIDHVVGTAIDGQREASRAYGSRAKHDNARGTYSVYQQSQEPGKRVVVVKNTKPESLSPYYPPQAIRIEFEPAYPDAAGTYDSIRFVLDTVQDVAPARERPTRENQVDKFVRLLRDLGPLTAREIALATGCRADYVRHLATKARNKAGYTILVSADDKYSLGKKGDEADGELGL